VEFDSAAEVDEFQATFLFVKNGGVRNRAFPATIFESVNGSV